VKIAAMSSPEQWKAVDQYLVDLLLPPNAALQAALDDSTAAGLPPINVSPPQGKMLQLIARACGAKRILEIGTLGGYSSIWLARALPPGGRLVTLEYVSKHANVARANFARAGLSDVIDLRVGRAIDMLPKLAAEQGSEPGFDLIFIDADKPSTADYFTWAVKLARPGGLIIVDNVVRKGHVVDAASTDENVQGIRRFMHALANEPRVSATAIQTVGGKGYDGFVLAVVNNA
jgi:predicted O-methyltransferase YrrM